MLSKKKKDKHALNFHDAYNRVDGSVAKAQLQGVKKINSLCKEVRGSGAEEESVRLRAWGQVTRLVDWPEGAPPWDGSKRRRRWLVY